MLANEHKPATSTGTLPEPSAMDVEQEPLPEATDLETGADGIPPARTALSFRTEKPVEGAALDDPVHHA